MSVELLASLARSMGIDFSSLTDQAQSIAKALTDMADGQRATVAALSELANRLDTIEANQLAIMTLLGLSAPMIDPDSARGMVMSAMSAEYLRDHGAAVTG